MAEQNHDINQIMGENLAEVEGVDVLGTLPLSGTDVILDPSHSEPPRREISDEEVRSVSAAHAEALARASACGVQAFREWQESRTRT